jgi:hypothetical protein
MMDVPQVEQINLGDFSKVSDENPVGNFSILPEGVDDESACRLIPL